VINIEGEKTNKVRGRKRGKEIEGEREKENAMKRKRLGKR